jgi:hypothetical protein
MKCHRASLISVLLALAAALLLPAIAQAKTAELGGMPDDVRGSCPTSCQAVSRTTGYQAKVGPDRALYQAPSNGRIVAWSIALGKPGPKQMAFFNDRLGGTAQAAIVVLQADAKLRRTVVAKAPVQRLTPYFGTMVQFPLIRTLAIKKGQYIGLTVPTWAPALQVSLGNDTSWRSSRAADGCGDTASQSAMLGGRSRATFRCLYRTARLTYSATFIPTPSRG